MIFIYSGILLSHKKNEILPFATTGMDFEGITVSEINQRKIIPYGFTHMWNLKQKK